MRATGDDMDFYAGPPTGAVPPPGGSIDMGCLESGQMAAAPSTQSSTASLGLADAEAFGLPQNMATSMVTTMLRGAREQAQSRGYTDIYAQIDNLRPFFDVQTHEVKQRLFWSFHPRKGSVLLREYDLYAPLMLAFTLVALLVVGMKHAAEQLPSSHLGHDSTLIGSALTAAFTFWGVGSGLLYLAAYLMQLPVRLAQVGCLTGYALAGVCAPLLVGLLPSALAFYAAVLLLGGCSAATVGTSFASLAEEPRHAYVIGGLAAGMNLLYTLYLRWMYFSQ